MSNFIDYAWAAGLFEGEGCIYRCNGDGIRLQINLTDHDVLSRYASVMDGRVTGPYDRGPRRKPIWSWTEARQAYVREVLGMFWEYLGERRRTRAVELGYIP